MEVPDFPYNQFSYVVPFMKVFAARNGSYFEKANRSVLIASLDSEGDAENSMFDLPNCDVVGLFSVSASCFTCCFFLSLCLLQKKKIYSPQRKLAYRKICVTYEEGKLCQARLR